CRGQSAGWYLRERRLHGRQIALLQEGHDVLDTEGVDRDYSSADVNQWHFVPGSRCCVAAASNAVQPHEWGRDCLQSHRLNRSIRDEGHLGASVP
ncbi:MAG: hypothetical protein ACK55Z_07925, partial [bacterium]